MNGHLWPDAKNVCFSFMVRFGHQEPSPQCKADSVGLSFQGRPWVQNMPLDLCKTPWNMQKICEEVRAGEGVENALETCECTAYLLNTYQYIYIHIYT